MHRNVFMDTSFPWIYNGEKWEEYQIFNICTSDKCMIVCTYYHENLLAYVNLLNIAKCETNVYVHF